jgi:hypothetical protein
MAYNYPEGWGTGPIRLRLLRHWSRSKDSMRGHWLFMIEPRWPIVRFSSEEHLDELRTLFPTKDDHTLDVVLEHYKADKYHGSCNGNIASIDLFCVARWMK